MEASCCLSPYEETCDSDAEAPRNIAGNPYDVKRVHASRKRGRIYEERRKIRSTRTARKLKQVREKIAACYSYELYSNHCGPSRLPASTGEEPLYDRATLLFEERVDLDFGLQDKLLANGVLSGAQYADIKTSQSSLFGARKLLGYTQGKSTDFTLALQRTKQHLLNYACSLGIYNSKYGDDWPLTDRQMMTLNVNQEVLVELMEMSPQLVEQLYSRNVLNKRHKEFIWGQPSKPKQSEVFLDILRRRSFRDYKETIRCLRASHQKHIAEIFKRGVVSRIFCYLRKPVKNSSSTASRIVDKCSEELSRWSVQGGNCNLKLTKNGMIDVRYDNGIVLYFHFKNQEELSRTKDIFCTGKMNAIAEADFNALLATDHTYVVLEWPADDLNRCDIHLLKNPLSETNIESSYFPMEVLEMILSKAYAVYFYAFAPHPREGKLSALLLSASRDWRLIIARRKFRLLLIKSLFPYFHMVKKRNTIIRSNRKYLVQNMEPTDILINRMLQFGCLTRKEADFIASLQQNTEKNQELLNIARVLSFKKHFAFVESLHFCGQVKVANVIEKGGLVFKANATCARISTDGDFKKRLNENVSKIQGENDALRRCKELFDVEIPNELEMLEVQHLGRRKGKEHIVIWLWCKSQKSSRQLCKLKESDQLFKRLDILMTYIWSEGTHNLYKLLGSLRDDKQVFQFLKTLRLDTMQFHREVAVRQLSPMFCGEFNLPPNSRALTSLEDKLYVLTDQGISIHQDMAPFASLPKIFFPPAEWPTGFPDSGVSNRWFIEACHQTKRIYVARRYDRRIWKLAIPNDSLEVWMDYKATISSLSVDSDGNVLIPKFQIHQASVNEHFLEIYTKDAVLLHNINLEIPLTGVVLESSSVLEISPGNFAINCPTSLIVRSVNFDTSTISDRIRYPHDINYYETFASIAQYSASRLIAIMSNQLAIFDSQLNVEIVANCNSFIKNAAKLHYRKDKRQLVICPPGLSVARICRLVYAGEDMFADDD